MHAYAQNQSDFAAGSLGIGLLGGGCGVPSVRYFRRRSYFGTGLEFGPSTSFGNAGMYQNQWEYASSLNWVKGRHTISAGVQWDPTQLNIVNNNTNTDTLDFSTFLTFVEGTVHAGDEFSGVGGPRLPVQYPGGVHQR